MVAAVSNEVGWLMICLGDIVLYALVVGDDVIGILYRQHLVELQE